MIKTKLRPLSGSTIQLVDGDRGVNYPNKKDFSDNGFCLFLDSSNLTKNGFDFSSKVFISKNKDEAMGNGKLKRGDLVMNTRGTIGNMGVYQKNVPYEDIRINSGMLIIRGGADYDNGFLYGFFRSNLFYKQVENIMSGSVQSQLPIWIFNFIQIPELNIPAQQKISAVLSVLDSKIELNNRINAELEAMAKTLYDYWFVQFDFPDKNGKPYKTNNGKMVWSEELKREIPEGWEVGTLLDIAEYVNGLPCQKYRSAGIDVLRVIKIKEMHEGFSVDSELVSRDFPSKLIIENGDMLFSWSASLDVQLWTGGKGALNQHIFKVNENEKKYPKFFYYFQLLDYINHFKMMAESRKTTMGHITQEHLQQSRIVIPPDNKLLLRADEFISPLLNKLVHTRIENQKLAELRDWLLPMLMNGQVIVN